MLQSQYYMSKRSRRFCILLAEMIFIDCCYYVGMGSPFLLQYLLNCSLEHDHTAECMGDLP